jgi:peptide deformylase
VAILNIRTLGDPILKAKASPVVDFDDALRRLAEDMLETMRAAPGVGLAAPQVGVLRRMFTFDDGEAHGALCNPEIVWSSAETQEAEEGCLSVPGYYFPVVRALAVRVQAFGPDGEPLQPLEAEGFRARIFQHEIDHLDGIIFIDRLAPELRKEALRQLREQDFGMRPPPRRAPAAEDEAAL